MPSVPRLSRSGAIAWAIAGMLAVAGVLSAHDFRLVPNAFGSAFGGASEASSDSAAAADVVKGYHSALSSGDSTTALRLLASDAVILESGGAETVEHYRSGHLPADIRFASAVPSVRGDLRVVVRGDVAWVSSTSTSRGEYRGRQINSSGAELVVLSREADGWKIRAIHWSSRNRNPEPR